MASEFIASTTETLIHTLRRLGVSQEVAGMVAAEWSASVTRDWGGERPYIGKEQADAARAMSRRDAEIRRAWQAGERIAAIARQHGISRLRVRQIVAEPGGSALP